MRCIRYDRTLIASLIVASILCAAFLTVGAWLVPRSAGDRQQVLSTRSVRHYPVSWIRYRCAVDRGTSHASTRVTSSDAFLIVPTLRVVTQRLTLCVTWTQSVLAGIPTQSVGTILEGSLHLDPCINRPHAALQERACPGQSPHDPTAKKAHKKTHQTVGFLMKQKIRTSAWPAHHPKSAVSGRSGSAHTNRRPARGTDSPRWTTATDDP